MTDLDYYISERFIHDGILAQAESSIPTLYTSWKSRNEVEPFLLTWPASSVTTRSGTTIDGVCLLELQDFPKEEWRSYILQALEVTKAYAVLLVERVGSEIVIIVESKHGSKSWRIPIQNRGDVRVLGEPKVRVDTDSLGYLWRPDKGQA